MQHSHLTPTPVHKHTSELTVRAVDGAKNMEAWADSRGSYPRRKVSSVSLRGTKSPRAALLPAVDCVRVTSGVPKPRRMVASSATLAHVSSPSLWAGRNGDARSRRFFISGLKFGIFLRTSTSVFFYLSLYLIVLSQFLS